jgi:hypothetical protein
MTPALPLYYASPAAPAHRRVCECGAFPLPHPAHACAPLQVGNRPLFGRNVLPNFFLSAYT